MNGKSSMLESAAVATLEPSTAPGITRVVPWVRWAVLVRHTPRLTDAVAAEAKNILHDLWPTWKDTYRKTIADLSGVPVHTLRIRDDEYVRLKYDGKTPMIDLPLLENDAFGLRTCVALCTDDYSSKVWARVGSSSRQPYGCDPNDIRAVVKSHRALARRASDWFYHEFFVRTAKAFTGHEQRRLTSMELEITTLGLQVTGDHDNDDFHSWLYAEDDQPNVENARLRRCISDALDIDEDIRDLSADSMWMSLPASGQIASGVLASRNFLYFAHPAESVLQIVGVGFDDTIGADLVSSVALKMSTYVASRI